jgi:hypothetical protein
MATALQLNDEQAYVWMMLASESGYPIAASEAKVIGQKLSAGQIERCNSQIKALEKTNALIALFRK